MAPEVQMEGVNQAISDCHEEFNISAELIICFLRHLGPAAAELAFDSVLPFKDQIVGIGLASSENGFPPELFTQVFTRARKAGFKTVAHAGEEGPWQYVQGSIDHLKVDRIDHGNRSCENMALIDKMVANKIPLTLCPLSNIKLKNVDQIENHTVKKMMDRGMMITINSDDPAYFGGYVNENLQLITDTFMLNENDITQLAKNSFEASFASKQRKKILLNEIDLFLKEWRTSSGKPRDSV